MGMRGLAGDLAERGIIVGMVAPGAADTDMRRELVGAERAARDLRPAEAVAGMIEVIDGLTQATSTTPLNYDGRALPW
jgi:NAD(P)-dependent dehydrogenase (short-subunit alcohol dehydrogenase family)